eukprot:COSAG06_NODE_3573_length_5172_cov_2.921545_1_plen_275_part_00
MSATQLLCWMVRFHLRWCSSKCADGEWCQWGDFSPPRGKGIASTYDRFQRTHGMMQDIDNVVCDDPSKAHHLLSSILTLVQQLIQRLQAQLEPQPKSLERFRRGLNGLACGFGALQTASFVVNLYVYRMFDMLPPRCVFTLVNGLSAGTGAGSKKFLDPAGFSTCLELRDAVLQQYPVSHYTTAIHVVENLPCEIKRHLQRLYGEFSRDGERILDWHKSTRQIKFVPLFGFPALTIGCDVPVQWVDIDPRWTWEAVEARWRAASRSRLRLPIVP